MSVILSPTEQAEVTRFGIHDEDVFEGIVEHRDDEVQCADCAVTAQWSMKRACCGRIRNVCQGHLDWWKRWLDANLAVTFVDCAYCYTRIRQGTPLSEIVTVVPL